MAPCHLHNRQSWIGRDLVLHRCRISLAHFPNSLLGPRSTRSLLGRLPYHRRRLDREGDPEDPSGRRQESLVSFPAKASIPYYGSCSCCRVKAILLPWLRETQLRLNS